MHQAELSDGSDLSIVFFSDGYSLTVISDGTVWTVFVRWRCSSGRSFISCDSTSTNTCCTGYKTQSKSARQLLSRLYNELDGEPTFRHHIDCQLLPLKALLRRSRARVGLDDGREESEGVRRLGV